MKPGSSPGSTSTLAVAERFAAAGPQLSWADESSPPAAGEAAAAGALSRLPAVGDSRAGALAGAGGGAWEAAAAWETDSSLAAAWEADSS